jgi:phosphoserine aminotransferase
MASTVSTKKQRPYNFAAGPAALPESVLEQVKDELLDWHGSGMSIMEMSHRSKEFSQVIEESQADIKELLNLPGNYKVLFLQGGATSQFSMVPLNLLGDKQSADYINTGFWSDRAIVEAKRYGKVNIAADSQGNKFTKLPAADKSGWQLDKNAAYVHYTANETIHGVEFDYIPETGSVPLVSDMSSNILSRPLDVSKFGLIYAGAQKNIGPAGLTIVIVRDDLLGKAKAETPYLFDYKTLADNASMANTPPAFAWYVAGLVFKWIKAEGGLNEMARRNERKANLLYKAIDESGFYKNPVHPSCRSRMNIPFTLKSAELEAPFQKEAKAAGLLALGGHRAVGGLRASLYNAVSEEAVVALTDFMKDFAKRHG